MILKLKEKVRKFELKYGRVRKGADEFFLKNDDITRPGSVAGAKRAKKRIISTRKPKKNAEFMNEEEEF
jgi:hypothetical protein